MAMTRTESIRILRTSVIVLVALAIIGYAIWRSLDYARGPAIVISAPENGSTILSSTTDVIGRADRVNSLSVNGKAISLDERGNFKETLIVFPGLNLITIDASDQFGRRTEKQLEITR